jgi:hypothetical protein
VLTAMAGEIALAVTVDVQPPNHTAPVRWRFPQADEQFLAPPRDVSRKTDIHR